MASIKLEVGEAPKSDKHTLWFGILFVSTVSVFTTFALQKLLSCDPSMLHNPYLLDSLPPRSSQLYEALSGGNARSSLRPAAPSTVVHYLWCGQESFTFTHFVSVMSTYIAVQPDEIVFHYVQLPALDDGPQISWFQSLRKHMAILSLRPLESVKECEELLRYGSSGKGKITLSGMLVSSDVALVTWSRGAFIRFATSDVSQDQRDKLNNNPGHLSGKLIYFRSPDQIYEPASSFSRVVECATPAKFIHSPGKSDQPCVLLGDIQPESIWSKNDSLSALLRFIAYNQEKVVTPLFEPSRPIPNICHLLHFPENHHWEDLDFMTYASVKSMLSSGGVNHVYIHGEHKPAGAFMAELLGSGRVDFVTVERVNRWSVHHAPLIYGLKTLLDYGGVLQTGRNIWTKKFPTVLQGYGAVGSIDQSGGRKKLSFSLLAAKRHSPFLQTLLPILQSACSQRTPKSCDVKTVAYSVYQQLPMHLKTDATLARRVGCDVDNCGSDGEADSDSLTKVLLWSGEKEPQSVLGLPPLLRRVVTQVV